MLRHVEQYLLLQLAAQRPDLLLALAPAAFRCAVCTKQQDAGKICVLCILLQRRFLRHPRAVGRPLRGNIALDLLNALNDTHQAFCLRGTIQAGIGSALLADIVHRVREPLPRVLHIALSRCDKDQRQQHDAKDDGDRAKISRRAARDLLILHCAPPPDILPHSANTAQ